MTNQKPKKITTNDVLLSLAETLKGIEEKLELIDAKLFAKVETIAVEVEKRPETPLVQSKEPVPADYREIVDTVLNQSFGISIESFKDQPAFTFSITVPETYSNAGKSYLEVYKVDQRPKTITFAEGALGVREWAEKVFNNLTQETRTRIVMDRLGAPVYT